MPQTLTLDHGTVFYDNTTPSPFPTRLHLWLLALGVQVRFTRKRCPTDHAHTLRTHQTMTAQALLGQTYPCHAALWAGLDERRQVLNHHLPSRALAHQTPLEAYPAAIHSGRSYRPEWEEEFLSLEKVFTYLAQGRWFRSVRTNGYFEGRYDFLRLDTTKSYLTTIVTHLCLDSLKSARRQREQYVSVWLPEPILTTDLQEPVWHTLEQHESISLALYPGLHFSSAVVNGTAGILVWSKETLLASIACEITEEQITNLYEVINPDKLASIQKQMQPHA